MSDSSELSGTWLTQDDLTTRAWAGVTVEESTFEECDLRRIRATSGVWRHVLVDRCFLEAADLAALDTADTSLLDTTLDGARLTGSTWLRSRWRDLDASELQADGLTAVNSSWHAVTIRDASLREADFTGSTWRHVQLIDCDLTAARFSALNVTGVSFSGCNLAGIVGIDSLRGATVGTDDAVSALGAMATHLGLRVQDGES